MHLMRCCDLARSEKNAIRAAFDTNFNTSVDDLRLKTAIVQELYGEPYGPLRLLP